ncbi:MAG: hypothetical protein Q7S12_02325 [bacterium]|nr:hypothetical protein [bacterium]
MKNENPPRDNGGRPDGIEAEFGFFNLPDSYEERSCNQQNTKSVAAGNQNKSEYN